MIENRPGFTLFCHAILILGTLVVAFPLYVAIVAASMNDAEVLRVPISLMPSSHLWENIVTVWSERAGSAAQPLSRMLLNSAIMALAISCGKIFISMLSAYAIVYFRFPLRQLCFWVIFATLMLPVEVRLFPTVSIVTKLHMMNSYVGLTLPLMASATATFLFRQFFMTLPNELVEASRIDGAGPVRFFIDTVLPLSRTNIAALFVITFIYGWNQYLWPLLVVSDPQMTTAVVGIKSILGGGDQATAWHLVMCTALLTLLPPLAVVLLMQRWFVKGLVDSEK